MLHRRRRNPIRQPARPRRTTNPCLSKRRSPRKTTGRKGRGDVRDAATSRAPRTRRARLQDWPGPRHLSRGAGILAQAGIKPMQDIRCGSCNRKLGAGEYIRLTIKCPRCRAMNVLRAERPLPAGRRASATRESPHATTHFR
ncbi:Com family DNA-binding transcriptional regulator [Burkholderia multivorans]|uniref:Com family DNA-binding transcriptional regulator n=1 Tax=Burkholderia multivorans TaxID=87883 RepID=UPI0030C77297